MVLFKIKDLMPYLMLGLGLALVLGVGWIVLKEVSDVPFKLCEDKIGLIQDPKQEYIYYDCDFINNITVTLT